MNVQERAARSFLQALPADTPVAEVGTRFEAEPVYDGGISSPATDSAYADIDPINAVTSVPIARIRQGNRFRHDMGDIDGLAASIKEHGLLHPVVITPRHELVAGGRRLLAAGQLGWTDVPVTILDLHDLVAAQSDENVQRLDFAVSEKVAIAEALWPIEVAAAVERKIEGGRHGGQAPAKSSGASKESATGRKDTGDSRKRVADAVGMSAPTLEKATEVVEAAKADPSNADIVEQMDATGNVSAAHRELERRQQEADLVAMEEAQRNAYDAEAKARIEAKSLQATWARGMESVATACLLDPTRFVPLLDAADRETLPAVIAGVRRWLDTLEKELAATSSLRLIGNLGVSKQRVSEGCDIAQTMGPGQIDALVAEADSRGQTPSRTAVRKEVRRATRWAKDFQKRRESLLTGDELARNVHAQPVRKCPQTERNR